MSAACPKSSSTASMATWWNRAKCDWRRSTPSICFLVPTAAARWGNLPASTPKENSALTTSFPCTSAITNESSLSSDQPLALDGSGFYVSKFALGSGEQLLRHSVGQAVGGFLRTSGSGRYPP